MEHVLYVVQMILLANRSPTIFVTYMARPKKVIISSIVMFYLQELYSNPITSWWSILCKHCRKYTWGCFLSQSVFSEKRILRPLNLRCLIFDKIQLKRKFRIRIYQSPNMTGRHGRELNHVKQVTTICCVSIYSKIKLSSFYM